MLIPKIKMPEELRAENVPQLMLANGVEYMPIKQLNWPDDYPYAPNTEVALAHTGSNLIAHFRVEEKCIRALATEDGGHVWEDSCCELFLQPCEDPKLHGSTAPLLPYSTAPYYNIECNCGGTLLVAAGESRHDRRQAAPHVMQAVGRWSSLGVSPIAMKEGSFRWQLALVIPAATLFESNIEDFTGLQIRANAYKCGDRLATPHFLSLFPIDKPKPDFHCPEFFQPLHFL